MITRQELNTVTAALRSGDYHQGYGGFYKADPRGTDKMFGCALGIAAWVLEGRKAEDFTQQGVRNFLPQSVLAMKIAEPVAAQIIHFNDAERRGFDFIADWMDKNVPVCLDVKELAARDYAKWKGAFQDVVPMQFDTFFTKEFKKLPLTMIMDDYGAVTS